MATFIPPKKGVQFIFYVGLVSQASAHVFQSNPTIAAGDFKVSIDGGALANPATLPAVTPASSKMVKITLSISEMNGDNVTVICSDAAGAEWDDLVINIQTVARQIDDLSFPLTSGRGSLIDTNGRFDVGSWLGTVVTLSGGLPDVNTKTITAGIIAAATFAANALDAVWATTARTLSASGVQAIWDALTSALTTVGSVGKRIADNLDTTVSSRSTFSGGAVSSVTGNVGGNVTGSVGSVLGNVAGTVGSVVGAVGSVTGNVGGNVNGNVVGSVGSVTGAVTLVDGQILVKRNVALNDFPFTVTSSVTHLPTAGLTVTGTRSIDGGAFAALANAVVEIGAGWYKIDFAASDLNGTTIAVQMEGAGADDRDFTIVTQE